MTELGTVGALSMLESRLERITAERDAARAEAARLRELVNSLAARVAAQAELLERRGRRAG